MNNKAKTLSLVSLFAIGSFALSQIARAVSPPPDGGYPGNNTAEGSFALLSLTSGVYNTGIGSSALRNNAQGNLNTAIGAAALLDNTADSNTAMGAGALLSNTIAFQNTANGAFALFSNTTGSNNTAVGADALFSNADGFRNNAFGILALSAHQTGSFNNAFGSLALASDQNGARNNAFGDEALRSNVTGTDNTAMGDFALHDNSASENTAIGSGALRSNTTGSVNTASGVRALEFNSTGGFNVALGYRAGVGVTTAQYVTCIGANVEGADVSGTCFIGNIRGVQTQSDDAVPVVIDSAGQLGTASSSARFKKDIRPMDNASEAILALKPVTFHYKNEAKGVAHFGLVAEEVAELNPDLVVRDENGRPYTVRYDAVNAMLLNEFLKEHRKLEELRATVAALKSEMNASRHKRERAGGNHSATQRPPRTSEFVSQRMLRGVLRKLQ
jgi:hypothetical protein